MRDRLEPLLTSREVAGILAISVKSVSRLTSSGLLPAIPLLRGKRTCWRYEPRAVRGFLRQQKQGFARALEHDRQATARIVRMVGQNAG